MSVTLLSPLGFIWAIPTTMYTHCGFSIHLKNDVGNLVYFRLFGCWSLVFGPTACASLACQRAAAAAANRGASGWDCGRGSEHVVTTSWLSVLGLRIRISCARTRMLFRFSCLCQTNNFQKAFRKPFRKGRGNHKPPVQEQAQNCGKIAIFNLGIQKIGLIMYKRISNGIFAAPHRSPARGFAFPMH